MQASLINLSKFLLYFALFEDWNKDCVKIISFALFLILSEKIKSYRYTSHSLGVSNIKLWPG